MTVVVERVSKRFDAGAVALDEIDLESAPGELLVVVGPTGCGKTTLLRVISGLERVHEGRVYLSGTDVTDLPPGRRRVGMVFQTYAIFPHLTVRENLGFGLRLRKEREIAGRVDEIASQLRLTALMDRRPQQISGGERQRVALGRALLRSPEVLLLDEPLSNLDARLRSQVRRDILDRQRAAGVTTIYVTHDQDEAMAMADRVAIMRSGRVLQIGTPREVYDRPASVEVAAFFGRDAMNLLPDETGTLGFRPEDAMLGESGDGFQARGRVVRVEQAGPDTLAWIATEAGDVVVRSHPADTPDVGSALRVSVPRNRLHRFGSNGVRK